MDVISPLQTGTMNSPQIISSGSAARVISPPTGLSLIGYPNPHLRANTGVGIDLFARAVVFGESNPDRPQAAIVVIDTLDVSPTVVGRIRRGAAARVAGLKAESVMVVATHTHSAPTLWPKRFLSPQTEPSTEYIELVVTQAIDAIAAGWESRKRKRLCIGRTEFKGGHNRRFVDEEGKATNVWEDHEGRHTGFFNPNVRFLALQDPESHATQALISFYACHPVVLGGGSTLVSADYPGYFIRKIEAALPGCHAIHITGAAAQINPRIAVCADPAQPVLLGDSLAKAVLDELSSAKPIAALPMKTHIEPLPLVLGPEASRNYSGRAGELKEGETLTSEMQVLRFGNIAVISAPGELFGEIGLAIENTSPFATTLVAGYTNDSLGYLCTNASFHEGGYEVRNVISTKAEASLISTARVALDRAAGMSD